MKAIPSCETCRWYALVRSNRKNPVHVCIHEPRVFVAVLAKGDTIWEFRAMSVDDVCAHYEAAENPERLSVSRVAVG